MLGNRLPIFLLVGCVLLVGCTAFASDQSPPPKPEPTQTPTPLPQLPEQVTWDNVREFTVRFETAYGFNERLTPNTTGLTITPEVVDATETDTGYLLTLRVGLSTERLVYVPEQHEWHEEGGVGGYTVKYLVNDTVVIRSGAAASAEAITMPDGARSGTVIIDRRTEG